MFLDFFDGAYKEKTSIKRDATSRKIMEALAKSDYYDGEVSLYNGYFVPKKSFPNNDKVYLWTGKDDYYILSGDNRYVPLRYAFSIIVILGLVLSMPIAFSNGFPFFILIFPVLFWVISRITRLFYKKDVELFMDRYNHMKKQFSKHADFSG